MNDFEITDRIRKATIHWISTIRRDAGEEVALKCLEVMREVVSSDLVDSVWLGILTGERGDRLVISRNHNKPLMKINAIREIRCLTKNGLREVKDLVESMENTRLEKDFVISDQLFELYKDQSEMLCKIISDSILALQDAGFNVR